MTSQITDQQTEGTRNRRESNDYRAFLKMARREEEAELMIGELSNGKLYTFPVGGKYREGTRMDLIAYLIRNNYA
jgi:hypothetical protein